MIFLKEWVRLRRLSNEIITLKLINRKTIIYVNGIEFKQCKYLLLIN